MFSPVSSQPYFKLVQNKYKCFKNRTANSVKSFSKQANKHFRFRIYKLENKRFRTYFGNSNSNRHKNLHWSKNRKANAVNPILILTNKHFFPYLGNRISNWSIINFNVLKIERQMPQTRFQTRQINIFASIFANVPPNDAK